MKRPRTEIPPDVDAPDRAALEEIEALCERLMAVLDTAPIERRIPAIGQVLSFAIAFTSADWTDFLSHRETTLRLVSDMAEIDYRDILAAGMHGLAKASPAGSA